MWFTSLGTGFYIWFVLLVTDDLVNLKLWKALSSGAAPLTSTHMQWSSYTKQPRLVARSSPSALSTNTSPSSMMYTLMKLSPRSATSTSIPSRNKSTGMCSASSCPNPRKWSRIPAVPYVVLTSAKAWRSSSTNWIVLSIEWMLLSSGMKMDFVFSLVILSLLDCSIPFLVHLMIIPLMPKTHAPTLMCSTNFSTSSGWASPRSVSHLQWRLWRGCSSNPNLMNTWHVTTAVITSEQPLTSCSQRDSQNLISWDTTSSTCMSTTTPSAWHSGCSTTSSPTRRLTPHSWMSWPRLSRTDAAVTRLLSQPKTLSNSPF